MGEMVANPKMVEALNSNTTWKFYYNQSYDATAKPNIDLPSNWSELNVVVAPLSSSYCFSFQIIKVVADLLVAASTEPVPYASFRQGFYVNSNDCSRAHILYFDNNTIKVIDAEAETAGRATGYRIVIAYR